MRASPALRTALLLSAAQNRAVRRPESRHLHPSPLAALPVPSHSIAATRPCSPRRRRLLTKPQVPASHSMHKMHSNDVADLTLGKS